MENLEKEELLRYYKLQDKFWLDSKSNPRNKKLRVESFRDKVCIVVPLPDGREFYLYPHYKALPLVEEDRMGEYREDGMNEFEALYDDRVYSKMGCLLLVDSPAAKYVAELGFELPTLMILQAIMFYREEINDWAKRIGGDIIADNVSCWSSSRCNTNFAWYARGNGGFFNNSVMCISHLCCPVSLKS